MSNCDESFLLNLGLTWGTPRGIDSWCLASVLAVSWWPAPATLPESDYQIRLARIWHFVKDEIDTCKDRTQEIQTKERFETINSALQGDFSPPWHPLVLKKLEGLWASFALPTTYIVESHFGMKIFFTQLHNCYKLMWYFHGFMLHQPSEYSLVFCISRQPGISSLKGFIDKQFC